MKKMDARRGAPDFLLGTNIEIAQDLTDSMLEREQEQASAQIAKDDSESVADTAEEEIKSAAKSTVASVVDSVMDALEKVLPLDQFDDCEADETGEWSVPGEPAEEVQREVSIENIQVLETSRQSEYDGNEKEFIAAIEDAIVQEFAKTEQSRKSSRRSSKREQESNQPRKSRSKVLLTRPASFKRETSRRSSVESTDESRLSQKYSSPNRMRDTSATLTEAALEELDHEHSKANGIRDIEPDDQSSSTGSSSMTYDSYMETEVETVIGKDLLDAFIDFMFQGSDDKDEDLKRTSRRSQPKSQRDKKTKSTTKRGVERFPEGTKDDDDSVQYESLINLSNGMSSESFAAANGSEPVVIGRKESNEDDVRETDSPGGLELDASFFEELWKEAVNTIKSTRIFETPGHKKAEKPVVETPSERQDDVERKEPVTASDESDSKKVSALLADDFLKDLASDTEDLTAASEASTQFINRVAASSNSDIPSPQNAEEIKTMAGLTLSRFKTKYPLLSKKLDTKKLNEVMKNKSAATEESAARQLKESVDKSKLENSEGDDLFEVEMNSSFMQDLHDGTAVTEDTLSCTRTVDDSMEESVECSLDDYRKLFCVMDEIGVDKTPKIPATTRASELVARKTESAGPVSSLDVEMTLSDHARGTKRESKRRSLLSFVTRNRAKGSSSKKNLRSASVPVTRGSQSPFGEQQNEAQPTKLRKSRGASVTKGGRNMAATVTTFESLKKEANRKEERKLALNSKRRTRSGPVSALLSSRRTKELNHEKQPEATSDATPQVKIEVNTDVEKTQPRVAGGTPESAKEPPGFSRSSSTKSAQTSSVKLSEFESGRRNRRSSSFFNDRSSSFFNDPTITSIREPRLISRIRSANLFGRRQRSDRPDHSPQQTKTAPPVVEAEVPEWDEFPKIDFSKAFPPVKADPPGAVFSTAPEEDSNMYTEPDFDFDMFERPSTRIMLP